MLTVVTSCFVAVPGFATISRLYLAAAQADFSLIEQLQRQFSSDVSVDSIPIEHSQRRFPSVVSVDLMIKEQPQRRFPSVVSVDQAAGVRILSAT